MNILNHILEKKNMYSILNIVSITLSPNMYHKLHKICWIVLHIFKQTSSQWTFLKFRWQKQKRTMHLSFHLFVWFCITGLMPGEDIWGHIHMMTSSNGNIFRGTGHLCGEFTGPGEFPTQRRVTRSFDVYPDLRPNTRLSKQSWGWWFQMPLRPLWRHRNEITLTFILAWKSKYVPS